MSTTIIVLITLSIVSIVAAAIGFGVVAFKKAQFNSKMKEAKSLVNGMVSGELYIVDFGRNITVEMEDLEIVNVGIGAYDYGTVGEALLRESVNGYRRRQLLSLECDIEAAYKLWNVQQDVTREIKQDHQVARQETRKTKFFTVIDTGKEMDGKVYVYEPTQFVLGDHLKAEIAKDKHGYLTIDTVWYAPEGNVAAPKALVPFDITTAEGSRSYAHYVENSGRFDEESIHMLEVIERLDKYNQLLEEGRIKKDGDTYYILPPVLKDPVQQVNEQFQEPAKIEELV